MMIKMFICCLLANFVFSIIQKCDFNFKITKKKDDDYCENNCNEDYKKCWLKYFKKMQELESGDSNEN